MLLKQKRESEPTNVLLFSKLMVGISVRKIWQLAPYQKWIWKWQHREAKIIQRNERNPGKEKRNRNLGGNKWRNTLQKSQEAAYKGKDISEVKNKSSTLKKVMNRAKAALWFVKSFGLEVEAITFKEVNTAEAHTSSMTLMAQKSKMGLIPFQMMTSR